MEYRQLGKTGMNVSIIGFGGIVAMNMPQEDANRAVARAIDRGVNYFDFAPSYGDDEERLGPALKGRRDGVYLACKTGQRDKEGASKELHRSLQRLQTDHFDTYQLHGVPSIEELDKIFAPDGAMEVLIDAKERGLTRFVGVTCHSDEVALEAFRRYDFDSILFPINFTCWMNDGLGKEMLKAAAEKNIGRIAMKGMAYKPWLDCDDRLWTKCWYRPIDDPELADLAVRWTLSQDVSVLMPPGHLELFELALDIADRFRPIEPAEIERLRAVADENRAIFSA